MGASRHILMTVDSGEDLQQRMSKAEQEAVKIQSLTADKTALTAEETARVFDLANAIQRLLQA